ncbi:MAG TPA: hypothetical protein VK163_14620 [Opitutaceae bacterium]|nr:hypothetical protein [Opitutaceae bacterium]
MRYAFFIGGFIGFTLTAATGFLSDRPGEIVFRDAAISCVVAAFLFRWFWSVVVKAFVEAAHQRRQQAAQSAKSGEESSASPAAQP